MDDATPSSVRNRAIVVRFAEEAEHTDWSDSDVSEDEMKDLCGELRELKKVASTAEPHGNADAEHAVQKKHRFDFKGASRAPTPMHVIFAIDTSKSMSRRDVGRKRRLDAVLFACRDFVGEQRMNPVSSADTYTLVSFSSNARAHFVNRQADSAMQLLESIRKNSEVEPSGESRFRAAFCQVRDLLGRGRENVQIVLLSDGRPHELNAVHSYLESDLLCSRQCTWLASVIVHTIGFGSNEDDFLKYLKPLSEKTGGLFQVAKLNESDLTRVFTTVASSLTSSRTSQPCEFPKDQRQLTPFDPNTLGRKCNITCDILQWKKINNGGKGSKSRETFKEFQVRLNAEASIDQIAFEHGGMRMVYCMRDTHNYHNDGTAMEMVAKRLHGVVHAEEALMTPFCKNTAMAISYRCSFIDAASKERHKIPKLFFVPCYMYRYEVQGKRMFFVGEQMLEGDFVKFNSNNGYVNVKHPKTEVLSAFSHFTYIKSRGRYIVVDLQGVVDDNTILLTDPQVVSRQPGKDRAFGPGDIGFEGIRSFFAAHRCGPTCDALGLSHKQDELLRELGVESRRCKICLDAASSTKLEPCGHSLVCEGCALRLMELKGLCPLCRTPICSYVSGTFSSTYVKSKKR